MTYRTHAMSMTLAAGLSAMHPLAIAAPSKAAELTPAQHLAQARSLAARSGYKSTFDLQCNPGEAGPSDLFGDTASPPPTRLFDDFFYVGKNTVGAYVLKTPDGLILIDSLTNEDDAKNVLIPGMLALGLDPADIKYLVISHGHGDHYGGASYIQKTYKPRVISSAADWDLMAKPLTPRAGDNRPPPKWGPAPVRDMVATDGQKLTLGKTTITMVITPGHTPGTISLIVPVADKGKLHMLAMWGGTAIPDDANILHQYVESFAHFETFTSSAGVDVELSNHPFVDAGLFKMEALRANPDGPNPLVIGTERYQDYTGVLQHCAQASGAATASAKAAQ
ncbi:MBL fold metallo-hydrolase [Sphingomonas sp. HMWF008]|nr:MBL fold metallo-hydrolase [Sphingomonas sp. HMWF008]